MKEKILALLVAKFAGVRKDGLAQMATAMSLQVENETEATALVEKLTDDKVGNFIKDWRKDVDKEVSDATKTHEKNLKTKFDFVEKKQDDGNNGGGAGNNQGQNQNNQNPTDIATIVANAIKSAVEPLQKELSSFKGEKITETRLQQLEGKFKDKNLPETFKNQRVKDFKRMNFESDEKFAEYLAEVETDITALNQEIADKGMSGRKPIISGKTDSVSTAVNAYIKDKTEQTAKNLTGKTV